MMGGWVTALTVYIVTWWVVLFTVLPWGAEPDKNPGAGHVASAPANPRLRLKFLITTVIAAIIWLAIDMLIKKDVMDFYREAENMTQEDAR